MDTKSLEQLGKTLIEEYGLENSTNTLERWMLHYLTELFDKEKSCTDENTKKSIQLEIKELILEFWRLRYHLADEDSLFKKNQILINALDKISTSSVTPISTFFNPYNNSLEVGNPEWQNKLLAIDKASKVILAHCVLKYLIDIEDKNNEIVELIESIKIFNAPESYLSRFYNDESIKEDKVENIEERIKNLTTLIDTAESIINEYKVMLDNPSQ